jgi:nicotinamide phosphoribosyltransferase
MTNATSPMLLADFYKISHRPQFPKNTEYVYSMWIARKSYMPGVNKTVAFGFQRFIIRYLLEYFEDNFFAQPIEEVVAEYDRIIANTLGGEPDHAHIDALHELGYMPLRICAVPEGTLVPLRVPSMTIENTLPEYFWLPNYVESLLSTELWMASTSATIAFEYRKLLEGFAASTNPEALDFVKFQGHDFSMRGMSTVEAGAISGLGHLLSFSGTDTIPAILEAERYYHANVETELVGTSVPATEHSVMCAGGVDDELGTYRRLITETYPSGIISIVSDTWDLWHVVTRTLGIDLHAEIMARDGKVVVRPDSGDPVDILCGTVDQNGVLPLNPSTVREKGVIQLLWEAFGGTVSSTGYKVLDPHIGCIYGDSITLERARQICERLEAKGFASTNTILGIGSYTYQYQTRDTFGTAMKATWVQIDGEERLIYKDPVTDDGTKKSLTGRCVVTYDGDEELTVIDGLTKAEEAEYPLGNILMPIFENGELLRVHTLADIRARLALEE